MQDWKRRDQETNRLCSLIKVRLEESTWCLLCQIIMLWEFLAGKRLGNPTTRDDWIYNRYLLLKQSCFSNHVLLLLQMKSFYPLTEATRLHWQISQQRNLLIDVDIKTFICRIRDKAEIKNNFSASPRVGPGMEITIGNIFQLFSNFDEFDIIF